MVTSKFHNPIQNDSILFIILKDRLQDLYVDPKLETV
jgi:hypothetical protein